MGCEAVTRPDTGHYRARQPFFPTWAPDWNVYRYSTGHFSALPDAKVSGNSRASFKFSTDGAVLTAEGICVASLNSCSERFELSTTSHKEMIRCLLGWRLLTQAHLGIHPMQQGDPRLDQFYRLMSCEVERFDQLFLHVKTWWDEWQRQLLEHKSVEAIEVAGYQEGYLQLIFDLSAGKRLLFYANPQGQAAPSFKLGMCPNAAKEGDLLCVLLGCRYPVILRRQDNHYILIGEALAPAYMKVKRWKI
jgi:hypothetical protein